MAKPDEKTKTSWIYNLRKEELQAELQKFELPTEGTVEELRLRLAQFIRQATKPAEATPAMTSPTIEPTGSNTEGFWYPLAALRTPTHVCETVRKWNLSFDGKTDPVAFLERLEELRTSYKLADEQLLIAIPELLKATALLWYRNNRQAWNTWDQFLEDFRAFYLPADYVLGLEEQISRRVQRTGETGREYIIDLQTLIRRHGGMSPAQELYRVYTNLLPDYRQYIRRRDCNTIQDLVREIEEYEKLQKELRNRHATNIAAVSSIKKPVVAPLPSNTAYDRKGTCWRCGGKGHFRQNCRLPPKLFCSHCGKEGTLTRDCSCQKQAGNANRTVE